jgi:hypothetical protein
MTTAIEDLESYIASAGDKPDAGIVRALTGAIAREAAAIVPPSVDSSPQKETAAFLREQHESQWARRGQLEAEAILAQPAWDRGAADQHRKEAYGRYNLGKDGESTRLGE